jgi:release factor glutamine methyltransferase
MKTKDKRLKGARCKMKTYRELFKFYEEKCLAKKIELSDLKFMFNETLASYNLNHIKNASDSIDEKIKQTLDESFKELEKGKPVQHILGYTYFYNLKINVNKDVLIPRFDTEVLVELVLFDNQDSEKTIVDVGTGSGCIAIALKNENSDFAVYATDISNQAISIARKNALENNTDIEFLSGDILEPLIEQGINVDIIVSNPPYISKNDTEVDSKVLNNEPHLALFSEFDGLAHIKSILEQSNDILNEQGSIYLEIGYKQAEAVRQLASKILKENHEFKIFKDMANKDRVVRIKFLK